MSGIKRIRIEELTPEAFEPYGRVFDASLLREAEFGGDGWRCWFPVQEVQNIRRLSIGITFAEQRDVVVARMERHPNNEEILLPINHPLVQPMGLPQDLDKEDAQPDPDTVSTF